ncbi:MAG: bifunctional pyr operon transcriptional regulator/uracil phosphoribosyltransferase PyrR [Proteobacteria bacterium]|nr:bifunctional pyr operon transcriptional regulator/uracil phosphoribosyltransferase PyrR [Pseudomonadota bacterium]
MSNTPNIPDFETLLNALVEALDTAAYSDTVLVGIRRGGAWIVDELHTRLGRSEPPGYIDISFYRDDFAMIGLQPEVGGSELPMSIDGAHVMLVDDVIHTGRTIRAAMNELFDCGRPKKISLASLIEREGHELPIRADICPLQLSLNPNEHVKLLGPEPLAFEVVKRK